MNRVYIRPADGLIALALAALMGCQQKMADQPSIRPDAPSELYPDGRATRPLVEGTVARGHLRIDSALFTGQKPLAPEKWRAAALLVGSSASGNVWGALSEAAVPFRVDVDEFPVAVTRELVEHGKDRFMIYCVVCHDPLGTGRGKIVERGYTQPPSYHIERLRHIAVGHFFDVITNGYGSMPSYREQIPPGDRWAITAFIRALQLSQHYPKDQLTPEMRTAAETNPHE